jgi:flagellar biosynthesis activator protein FlaF
MQQLASKAYGAVQQRTAGDKEIERAVFRDITAELIRAEAAGPMAAALRTDALSRNLQLWTLLATDLLQPGNALPDALKQRLLSLATYVQRASLKLLASTDTLADVIAVNEIVLGGALETTAG